MSSHNTKPEFSLTQSAYRDESEQDEQCVYKRTLIASSNVAAPDASDPELSLSEDFGDSGDPYNSTGRHVILKAKFEFDE